VKNEEIVIPVSKYTRELIDMGEPKTLLGYSLLRGVVKRNALIPSMTNQKSNEVLKQVCKAAGIDKNVCTHDGRHTFATLYLEAGGSVEVLQRLMGHSNITTTMIYVHISAERVKSEARRVFENWRA
jgi:site-specific recombinase XerD